MKTGHFIWDRRKRDWVPAHKYRRAPLKSMQVMPDSAECVSPIDGTVLGSRSTRREHMRRHGVMEVGNEPVRDTKPCPDVPGLGQDIKRTWERLYG